MVSEVPQKHLALASSVSSLTTVNPNIFVGHAHGSRTVWYAMEVETLEFFELRTSNIFCIELGEYDLDI